MNFLNVFEERIGAIFDASFQDLAVPFSFKKLAKKASREMENETFVIDGVNTAPALYTILIASKDDAAMKAAYPKITREIARFLEARAASRAYTFVGQPVVRFMADPSLKSGKFSVFAENVDTATLDRLRKEEDQYLRQAGAEQSSVVDNAAPDVEMAAKQHAAEPIDSARVPKTAEHDGQTVRAPQRSDLVSSGSINDKSNIADRVSDLSSGANPAVSYPVRQNPSTAARFASAHTTSGPVSPTRYAPQHDPHAATCLLINRSSGQTYTAHAPQTIIGRKRTSGGIVLHDSNISRCHAELSYDGHTWRIRDLNSTNGTLVNDMDITDCKLSDGDLITLGLINLEFREN